MDELTTSKPKIRQLKISTYNETSQLSHQLEQLTQQIHTRQQQHLAQQET